jgi:hypothetical protein
MTEETERELDKRLDDIREIRDLLDAGKDRPLCYPWAFYAWALLIASGTIAHFLLFRRTVLEIRAALTWIWCPVMILGFLAEGISCVLRIGQESIPLLSGRLRNAALSTVAAMVVFVVLVLRLAPFALSPGMAILLCMLPLIFYIQAFYASLFLESFAGIAFGLLLEFSGARSPAAYVLAGLLVAALFAASGIHAQLIERRRGG